MDGVVRLCHVRDLPEGSSRGFDPTGAGRDTMFVVCRNGLRGWRNLCPHWAGTSMAWRKDAFLNADATRIVCAAHGAQFEIESGLCTLGPCVGDSLTAVQLTHTEDGTLMVDVSQLAGDWT
jgi:nitrite reductase/ring-hydroxylating ferredoxin subunit